MITGGHRAVVDTNGVAIRKVLVQENTGWPFQGLRPSSRVSSVALARRWRLCHGDIPAYLTDRARLR